MLRIYQHSPGLAASFSTGQSVYIHSAGVNPSAYLQGLGAPPASTHASTASFNWNVAGIAGAALVLALLLAMVFAAVRRQSGRRLAL